MEPEAYPPDRDDLPESYDYVIERDDYAAVRYTHYGKVAHIWKKHDGGAACGMDTWAVWYGSGSMKEIETAHRLPLCKRCLATMGYTHLERETNPR